MDFIRSKGLPVSTPVVIVNLNEGQGISCRLGVVKNGEPLISFSNGQEEK